MKRPNAFIVLLEKTFPYRFLLAKMTHVPVFRYILNHLLFHHTNLTYLVKDSVVTHHLDVSITQPGTFVLPSKVVEHFIRKASRRFIMDFCICRQANHCKNHPIELGCIFLGDGVKDINPAYGREVSLQEALDHVETCRKNGLIHLIGRDTIDKTWLQVKHGEKLMTICNCCSCCCLWKWAPALHPDIGAQIRRMPGVTILVDGEKCVGCKICVDHCFMHAIEIKNNKAVITEECRGCGRCVELCPSHAIHLHIDDEAYMDKTQERLEASVDVS